MLIIRLSVNNLAGVSSVVLGLFGAAALVVMLHFGKSLLAGVLKLGVLILPTIVSAAKPLSRRLRCSMR